MIVVPPIRFTWQLFIKTPQQGLADLCIIMRNLFGIKDRRHSQIKLNVRIFIRKLQTAHALSFFPQHHQGNSIGSYSSINFTDTFVRGKIFPSIKVKGSQILAVCCASVLNLYIISWCCTDCYRICCKRYGLNIPMLHTAGLSACHQTSGWDLHCLRLYLTIFFISISSTCNSFVLGAYIISFQPVSKLRLYKIIIMHLQYTKHDLKLIIACANSSRIVLCRLQHKASTQYLTAIYLCYLIVTAGLCLQPSHGIRFKLRLAFLIWKNNFKVKTAFFIASRSLCIRLHPCIKHGCIADGIKTADDLVIRRGIIACTFCCVKRNGSGHSLILQDPCIGNICFVLILIIWKYCPIFAGSCYRQKNLFASAVCLGSVLICIICPVCYHILLLWCLRRNRCRSAQCFPIIGRIIYISNPICTHLLTFQAVDPNLYRNLFAIYCDNRWICDYSFKKIIIGSCKNNSL